MFHVEQLSWLYGLEELVRSLMFHVEHISLDYDNRTAV